MAQFIMLARAVAVGVGAVVTVIQISKAVRRYKKGSTCSLCGVMFETSNTTVSICNLQCGHKFHDSCIRAYVHSLRNCTMKCPLAVQFQQCPEKNVMGDAERRHFELWVPEDISYCHICLKIVKKNAVQSLPCWHSFCKNCLRSYIPAMELIDPPPKCPMTQCAAEIPEYVIESILNANMQ